MLFQIHCEINMVFPHFSTGISSKFNIQPLSSSASFYFSMHIHLFFPPAIQKGKRTRLHLHHGGTNNESHDSLFFHQHFHHSHRHSRRHSSQRNGLRRYFSISTRRHLRGGVLSASANFTGGAWQGGNCRMGMGLGVTSWCSCGFCFVFSTGGNG
jgi:hypothetical protein